MPCELKSRVGIYMDAKHTFFLVELHVKEVVRYKEIMLAVLHLD